MTRLLPAAVAALTVFTLGPVGCVTSPIAPTPDPDAAPHVSVFPSRDRLEQISTGAPPPVTVDESFAVVTQWTLTGPFPEPGSHPAQPADTALDRAFVPMLASARPGLEVDGALACVAREAGFYVTEKTWPVPDDLLVAMGGHCGAGLTGIHVAVFGGEVPDAVKDDDIIKKWSPQVNELIGKVAKTPVDVAGLWAGRRHGKAMIVIASGIRRVELTEVSPVPGTPGAFTVRGRLLKGAAEKIGGRINRGAFGFGVCDSDPSVLVPMFSLRCQGAPEDGQAWIQIATWPANQVLGDPAALVVVAPSGTPDRSFGSTPFNTKVDSTAPLAAQFLSLVNEVRARAGMPPMTLETAETATAERLAPHYFEAELKTQDRAARDVIALGLMAGWDVSNTVQRGTFTSSILSGSPSVSDAVTAVLRFPVGRAALLDPKARSVALGVVSAPNGNAMGVVASAYIPFEKHPMQEDAARVMAALNRARVAKGLKPATWVEAPGGSIDEAVRAVEEQKSPRAGTNALMRAVVDATNTSMTGWTMETWDLDEIQFPPSVVMSPDLGVVLAVTPYRDPREPWGGYVIMMVLPKPEFLRPMETASLQGSW